MKCIVSTLVIFLSFISKSTFSQSKGEGNDLKAYFLVILKKGPNRDQDSVTAAKIQKRHLENINKMAANGKLNVAGPFLDDGEAKGIFIFDVNSEEEVIKLVENDPAVRAGRLTYEIHPWMTQKGTCFK